MSTILYDRSIFAKYFASNDSEISSWVENVVIKLYEKGIVPNYIARAEGNQDVDDDYNVYWTAIATYLAFFVKLGRTFDDFKEDDYLALQYLTNLNTFAHNTESLQGLQWIISNRLRDVSRRGTIEAITPSANTAHGELLRLIGWIDTDYFKLAVGRSKHNSWNLDNSCPLGGGNTGRYDLNSAWEYTESVEDLTVYPLLRSQDISIATYQDKECMFIQNVPNNEIAGIGANEADKRIVVSPSLNFEITFDVAQSTLHENLTFGCLAFNRNGDLVSLKSCVSGSNDSYFFTKIELNKTAQFYSVRGIIYNKDFEDITATQAQLNIGYGNNLRFTNSIRSIIPYIVVDNDNGDANAGAYITNIKVTPCSLPHRRHYLNNKNFIDVLFYNKSNQFSVAEINSIFRKYFIPYNTAFKLQAISLESEDDDVDPPPPPPAENLPDYLVYEDNGLILYDDDSDDTDSDSTNDNDAILLEIQT